MFTFPWSNIWSISLLLHFQFLLRFHKTVENFVFRYIFSIGVLFKLFFFFSFFFFKKWYHLDELYVYKILKLNIINLIYLILSINKYLFIWICLFRKASSTWTFIFSIIIFKNLNVFKIIHFTKLFLEWDCRKLNKETQRQQIFT